MSAVSVSTTAFLPTQKALAQNLKNAASSATKMSTSNAITYAHEDPTNLTIGQTMGSTRSVLEIVAKGIEQSKSMLNIAEEGVKSAFDLVKRMKETLAKGKLGHIDNTLIKNTLSPTFNQILSELDRIANDAEFNGIKLLNGQGGVVFSGVASTFTPKQGFSFEQSFASLSNIISLTGLEANVNGVSTKTGLAFAGFKDISVSGGTITHDKASNKIILKDAVLRFKADVTPNGGTTLEREVEITDVEITIDKVPSSATNGSLTDENISTIKFSGTSRFSVNTPARADKIDNLSAITGQTVSMDIDKMTVRNVRSSGTLSGGDSATSTFTFVTGTDLLNSKLSLSLPVITVENLVRTANVADFKGESKPTTLVALNSEDDVDHNIGLVDAIAAKLLISLGDIAASETRLNILNDQLDNSVNQLQMAEEVITKVDLAKETAEFAKSSSQVNIAVAVLKQLAQSMQALERIVS